MMQFLTVETVLGLSAGFLRIHGHNCFPRHSPFPKALSYSLFRTP